MIADESNSCRYHGTGLREEIQHIVKIIFLKIEIFRLGTEIEIFRLGSARPELFFRHENPKSFPTHSSDISAPTQTELFYCQAIAAIMSSVWEWLQGLTKNMKQNKIPTDLC